MDLAVFSEAFGPPDYLEFSGVLSEARWNTEPMIEAVGIHPSVLDNIPPVLVLRLNLLRLLSTVIAPRDGLSRCPAGGLRQPNHVLNKPVLWHSRPWKTGTEVQQRQAIRG